MNTISNSSNVNSQSVSQKLKSLASTIQPISNDNLLIKDNITTNNTSNKEKIKELIINIIKYLLLIYIIIYLIMVLLNYYNLLSHDVINKFKPFDLFNVINKKAIKKKQDDLDNQKQLVTNYEKEEVSKSNTVRSETIPPTPLPQQDNPMPKPVQSIDNSRSKFAENDGFCFIGQDRGFRSCVKINKGDKCMSGDIFPTQAVCIDPNLRA